MILTGPAGAANLAAMFQGFQTLYLDAYQASEVVWPKIASRTPSNAVSETYGWLAALPGMKKFLGEITLEKLSAHGHTINNDEWYDAVAVKELDIRTDRLGIYGPRFTALGQVAKQHPDEIFAELLAKGFTLPCYTGKNFFDSDHEPKKGGKKFTNKGTKKLSATNFETAKASLSGRMNAEGRSMKLGKALLLVVTPEDEATARRILIADVDASGATNINKGSASLLVMPELNSFITGSNRPWFLLETGKAIKPMTLQVVMEPELIAQDKPNDQGMFNNHEARYQAYGIYGAGYLLPELAYGSDGSAAA